MKEFDCVLNFLKQFLCLTFLVWVGSDYLQERAKGSTMYGFKGGPAGVMKCKYVELTADFVYPYRNQVQQHILY
jgi:hypothetical protein